MIGPEAELILDWLSADHRERERQSFMHTHLIQSHLLTSAAWIWCVGGNWSGQRKSTQAHKDPGQVEAAAFSL